MKKVAFYTLGCKLNFSETSTISRQFEEKGFLKVDFQESPDIFIINTCSVTDNADKKCKKLVREAKKISPDSYVAIIGCYAQLKPMEIAEIEGVDAVLGAAEKFRLLELLDGFAKEQETKVLASEIAAATNFETSYSLHDRTRTFLKVQDGCNYGCAFCNIPLARGKSRSSSIDSILASARDIAACKMVKWGFVVCAVPWTGSCTHLIMGWRLPPRRSSSRPRRWCISAREPASSAWAILAA